MAKVKFLKFKVAITSLLLRVSGHLKIGFFLTQVHACAKFE